MIYNWRNIGVLFLNILVSAFMYFEAWRNWKTSQEGAIVLLCLGSICAIIALRWIIRLALGKLSKNEWLFHKRGSEYGKNNMR